MLGISSRLQLGALALLFSFAITVPIGCGGGETASVATGGQAKMPDAAVDDLKAQQDFMNKKKGR